MFLTVLLSGLGSALTLGSATSQEATPIRAVATFSILGDLVRQVGGDRVVVSTLVGPDADAHGYNPAPGDARTLLEAQIVFVNGIGFEGWIDRLIKASGSKAPVITASTGVATIADQDHGHDHGKDHPVDPHAWQSIPNAKRYVANIRDGLARVDPAHAAAYAANAAAYLARLDALDARARAAIAAIPADQRRVITTHDAFGYFGAAYGLRFIAPQGVSSDSEASPRDVARIIRQIRKDKIPAVFLENIADPRLMQQIAKESGARIGGKVYSDALSKPDGPAASYIDMMTNNLAAFGSALTPP
ncbi:zinc ABC transporter substrate-binding protein [Methylobacterium sp. Leaf108]|uniref:metal ABC transporter solute-binding protein, Zn/Mn family n=1 Tax=Methylobacterium sp. Leaf108 TaxID=1736256 RepID=UPI001FCDC1DC|nr:zinc ABC transporter substrate-binding protein [Methylobacterium sp. Leaf108]